MEWIVPPLYFFPLTNALAPSQNLVTPFHLTYFDTTERRWIDLPSSIKNIALYSFRDVRSLVISVFNEYERYRQESYPLKVLANVALTVKVFNAKRATTVAYSTGWRGFAQRLIEQDFGHTLDSIRSLRSDEECHKISELYHFLSILYCLDETDLLSTADYRSIANYILSQQSIHGGFRAHPVYDVSNRSERYCRLESTLYALLAVAICDFVSGDNHLTSTQVKKTKQFLAAAARRIPHQECSGCQNGLCAYADGGGFEDTFFLLAAIRILADRRVRVNVPIESFSDLRKRAEKVIPISSLLTGIPRPDSTSLFSCLSQIDKALLRGKEWKRVDAKIAKTLPEAEERNVTKTIFAFGVQDLLADSNYSRACLYTWLGGHPLGKGALSHIGSLAPFAASAFLPYIWRWLPSATLRHGPYLVVYDDDHEMSINVRNLAPSMMENVRLVNLGKPGLRIHRDLPRLSSKKRLFETETLHVFGALNGRVNTIQAIRPHVEDRLTIPFDRTKYSRSLPTNIWSGHGKCYLSVSELEFRFGSERFRANLQASFPPLCFLPRTRGAFTQLLESLSTQWSFDRQELARRLFTELGGPSVWADEDIDPTRLLDSVWEPRFDRWLSQFDPHLRKWAFRLYEMSKVYYPNEIRQMFAQHFHELPKRYRKKGAKIAFVGLGTAGKSGPHLIYYFRQANGAFIDQKQIITMQDISAAPESVRKADILVFVDDVIGSGQQAARTEQDAMEQSGALDGKGRPGFFTVLFTAKKTNWLKHKKVIYLALCGLTEGIEYIRERHPNVEVRCGNVFRKAFDDPRLSADPPERARLRELFRDLGAKILPRTSRYMADLNLHALGWDGSEALVSFPYNTPNNTLPIFWSPGNDGHPWVSIYQRIEP